MDIFLGLLGVVAGILYLKYNYKITNMIGKFPWAENYLGAGGTYTFHKIFAVLTIILSIMWMTGTLQEFIGGNVSRYFGGR
ncbi:MAG: hypothetical protein A2V81_00995 [Candidatus Abawacabacteria bacterium RBG_16_42_10]|uniref:Sulphur transport domain-containing protein n=1 Tax=Candidatus Abawacabacteria bacterium RBG_16_42_10 TaxID=1817814 RepID=A0A1F4XLL3_9BACT|nr:MAG: hypothetical protein A2V81_00995 [Candidatus Abawacabacteria bacterium RBG_16_42_10]